LVYFVKYEGLYCKYFMARRVIGIFSWFYGEKINIINKVIGFFSLIYSDEDVEASALRKQSAWVEMSSGLCAALILLLDSSKVVEVCVLAG